MTTRTASPEDLPALLALDPLAATNPARADQIRQAVAANTCFVATARPSSPKSHATDSPIGYACFHHRFFGHGLIELLVTHPAHRRQGVASALIRHCERHACQSQKLFTSTNRSNTPMRALLTKLGFTQTGAIDALDEGDPELIYVKRLPTPRP
jgi:ribosomal protein S18 acetylase RimI-like enzyme